MTPVLRVLQKLHYADLLALSSGRVNSEMGKAAAHSRVWRSAVAQRENREGLLEMDPSSSFG